MSESPIAEAGTKSATQIAEVATLIAAAAQAAIRIRARHLAEDAARDQAAAAAIRVQHRAEQNEARVAWSPALDRRWLASAGTNDVVAAWSAAFPWAGEDPSASRAVSAAEDRLTVLHPDAMAGYREALAGGASAETALLGAIAGEALNQAAAARAVPDLAATAVDEHGQGVVVSGEHGERADVSAAQARAPRTPPALAAEDYPEPARAALPPAQATQGRRSAAIPRLARRAR